MTFLSSVLMATAITWFPSADWVEKPNSVASPHAKKGGIVRFFGSQAPKSHNAYIDNNSYTIMMFSLMYDQLVSTDPDTLEMVPSLAAKWGVSEDGREFTFVIDERAVWSDGVPVSARDVKWTFDTVMDPKSDSGPWKTILGDFESPEILDPEKDRPIEIRFRKKGNSPRNWRDLMHCGTFWVMPMHAFADKDFNKIDFVGAVSGGPYAISRVEEQVETEYTRVKTWWKASSPSCRYLYNFDKILVRYFAGQENGFAALKKKIIDVYPTYTARLWVKGTKGKAFDRNWIVKRRVSNHEPVGYQGFVMNMREFPFDDVRVRKAMAKLIDRVMMNRTMMYGEYFMQNSFFCDLYNKDHPCTNGLLLFDPEGAKKLLEEAGFVRNPVTGILEKDGRPFRFNFLSRAASEDKFLIHFDSALKSLGIEMSIVRKDFANWMKDMDDFNFQMTWSSMSATVFRNPELVWLSSEADRKQSNNYSGFKSKEVDELLKKEKSLTSAADRNELYRQIDRLVTAEHPYAFLWNIAAKRLLYWNKFGMPESVISKYNQEDDVLAYWWYDEDKVRELNEAMENDGFLPQVPFEVDFDEEMARKK